MSCTLIGEGNLYLMFKDDVTAVPVRLGSGFKEHRIGEEVVILQAQRLPDGRYQVTVSDHYRIVSKSICGTVHAVGGPVQFEGVVPTSIKLWWTNNSTWPRRIPASL